MPVENDESTVRRGGMDRRTMIKAAAATGAAAWAAPVIIDSITSPAAAARSSCTAISVATIGECLRSTPASNANFVSRRRTSHRTYSGSLVIAFVATVQTTGFAVAFDLRRSGVQLDEYHVAGIPRHGHQQLKPISDLSCVERVSETARRGRLPPIHRRVRANGDGDPPLRMVEVKRARFAHQLRSSSRPPTAALRRATRTCSLANAAATTNLFAYGGVERSRRSPTRVGRTLHRALATTYTGATRPISVWATAWRLATANPGTVTVTDGTSSHLGHHWPRRCNYRSSDLEHRWESPRAGSFPRRVRRRIEQVADQLWVTRPARS